MDVNEQFVMGRFWYDGTRVTFDKVKLKGPCTGFWKGYGPILIWDQGHTCVLSQEEYEVQ